MASVGFSQICNSTEVSREEILETQETGAEKSDPGEARQGRKRISVPNWVG